MPVNPLPRLPDGRAPVVTSGFGPRPIKGKPVNHAGVDMAYRAAPGDPAAKVVNGRVVYTPSRTKLFFAPDGVPVMAYDDGVVVQASVKPRINGDVWLEHKATGLVTRYAHLRPGSLVVRVGQRVRAGQKLGIMGASTDTPFRHLHFAMLRAGVRGSYFDPGPQLADASIVDGPGLAPADAAPRRSEAIARGAASSGGFAWVLFLLPFALASTRS